METTRLSSKGQVILPKSVRDAHQWRPGTEFIVENTADGVLLRPAKPFPPTRFEDVVGCLRYARQAQDPQPDGSGNQSGGKGPAWSRSILTSWFGC